MSYNFKYWSFYKIKNCLILFSIQHIRAIFLKDGSEILIQQEDCNPRKLTPREAARLQGFPEKFKIPVSNTQAYRQFGNSVPVKVVEKVAEQMLLHLEKRVIKIKPNKKIQRAAKSVTPFSVAKDHATSVCR